MGLLNNRTTALINCQTLFFLSPLQENPFIQLAIPVSSFWSTNIVTLKPKSFKQLNLFRKKVSELI